MEPIKRVFSKSFFCVLILLFAISQLEVFAQDLRKQEVVFSPPEMDQVKVHKGTIYKKANGEKLSIDLYYPPSLEENEQRSAVIFALGYPKFKLKNMQQYVSWGKLTALNGQVGVTYETSQPKEDLADLVTYLRENSEEVGIDKNRIGIWSCSGNVPVTLSYLSDYDDNFLRFGVFYYGFMPTPDQKYQDHINHYSKTIAPFISPQFTDEDQLSGDLPLFVVSAGQDTVDKINDTIHHFVSNQVSKNAPITFVNHKTGQHAFDILDENQESRRIIKQTLTFMEEKLASK